MEYRRFRLPLLFLAVTVPLLASGRVSSESGGIPKRASVRGVVLSNFLSRGQVRPTAGIPVYLIALEDAAGLTKLQQEAYQQAHRAGLDERQAGLAARKYYDHALGLVLRLRGRAKAVTKSDKNGFYRFLGVPVGKAYKIIAVEPYEDDVILAIQTTPVVKPGQRLRLDLNDQDPWWETPAAWAQK